MNSPHLPTSDLDTILHYSSDGLLNCDSMESLPLNPKPHLSLLKHFCLSSNVNQLLNTNGTSDTLLDY